ncbi:Signal transduction histidine kinase [Haloechinothrix alba]|uniref:histidine kinase n=1 Tax=Haloechinothrix alba TaxID=664784 RepID=A0A238VP14_9PSEU|nr:nitrate- and nitrite sensing domain-containing protein [Haloechinothrix alba]SNR35976.1 Signal transduction histidine kinase [Haloechinothrix alba]
MADTGQEQVPVEKLLGRQPQRSASWRHRLATLSRWRDWNLPVKLAAVTIVPILIAAVLGVSTLNGQLDRVSSHERTDSLLSLSGEVGLLLDLVQQERTETVASLVDGMEGGELDDARAAVDNQIDTTRQAAEQAVQSDRGMADAVSETENVLGQLGQLREDADAGQLEPVAAIDEYSVITEALLGLDAAAVSRMSEEALGGTPQALLDLRGAQEATSAQQSLVAYGIERGILAPSELSRTRTAEVRIEDRLAGFEASATPEQRQLFDTTISGPSFATRERMASAAFGELGSPTDMAVQQLPLDEWTSSSSRIVSQLSTVGDELHAEATDVSAALLADARKSVTLLSVLLGLAFALALFVVFVITRHLLRSLRELRSSAMQVAEERLPAAVRDIQDDRSGAVDIAPVPVSSRDEVGQVARAFDAVHDQALRLASEQATMRSAYNSVFVNLSRRSQSLVQRQLQLIEQLERDEEDADQLATLFHLDHLATRMRRNNENLMVLSGSESARRSGRPVSTADVLRAAVSEIEQYQRVVVPSPPTTKIVGHAASDLMRLLAELLENATAFSPPESQVTIATSVAPDSSMTMDVLDSGIGMSDEEVAEANARMRASSPVDLVSSRRMGLFVVGRLASKHGFSVTLYGGKETEGVRACVTVPAQLVIGADGGPLTTEMPAITEDTQLPRRQPGASGVRPSGGEAAQDKGAGQQEPVNGSHPRAAQQGIQQAAQQTTQQDSSGAGPATGSASTDLFTPAGGGDGSANQAPDGGNADPGAGSASPRFNGLPQREAPDTSSTGELPTGEALFAPGTAPLSDWWSSAAAEPVEHQERPQSGSRPETTPIFDEMLSVWFRTSLGSSTDSSAEQSAALSTWDFAADKNWQTVRKVANSAPEAYTEAGLPRRERGEQLLPGSATSEPAEATPSRSALGRADLPARDPHDVRGRLSNFQRGVSKGRNESKQQPEAGSGGAGEGSVPDGAGRHAQGAEAPEASGYTDTGLPRRRRGEQLVAGSVSGQQAATAGAHQQPERDPNAMRGRLSSFQQGIRRGRSSMTQPAEDGSDEKREIGAGGEA